MLGVDREGCRGVTESGVVTINSRKADGSIRRSWSCELLERRDAEVLFVGIFETQIDHPDLGHIAKGTVSYEYYWLDRWYNIFAFYEPDGTFRNYYCNVCVPPVYDSNVLDYVDLEIDIVVWPDWTFSILDEDEYESNAAIYGYSEAVRANAAAALEQLQEMIVRKDLPVRH